MDLKTFFNLSLIYIGLNSLVICYNSTTSICIVGVSGMVHVILTVRRVLCAKLRIATPMTISYVTCKCSELLAISN